MSRQLRSLFLILQRTNSSGELQFQVIPFYDLQGLLSTHGAHTYVWTKHLYTTNKISDFLKMFNMKANGYSNGMGMFIEYLLLQNILHDMNMFIEYLLFQNIPHDMNMFIEYLLL